MKKLHLNFQIEFSIVSCTRVNKFCTRRDEKFRFQFFLSRIFSAQISPHKCPHAPVNTANETATANNSVNFVNCLSFFNTYVQTLVLYTFRFVEKFVPRWRWYFDGRSLLSRIVTANAFSLLPLFYLTSNTPTCARYCINFKYRSNLQRRKSICNDD